MIFVAERIQPAGFAVGFDAGDDENRFGGGREPWTDAVCRGGGDPGLCIMCVADAGPGERGIAGRAVEEDDEEEGAAEKREMHEGFAGCSFHFAGNSPMLWSVGVWRIKGGGEEV